jgi:hypothetical protein
MMPVQKKTVKMGRPKDGDREKIQFVCGSESLQKAVEAMADEHITPLESQYVWDAARYGQTVAATMAGVTRGCIAMACAKHRSLYLQLSAVRDMLTEYVADSVTGMSMDKLQAFLAGAEAKPQSIRDARELASVATQTIDVADRMRARRAAPKTIDMLPVPQPGALDALQVSHSTTYRPDTPTEVSHPDQSTR